MTPYYLFLAIVMAIAFYSSEKTWNKPLLFSALVVMVLFAGLRSSEVGTDAMGYARSFIKGRQALEGSLTEQVTDEVGYYYLDKYLSAISKKYVVLFMGIALLTYSCVLTAIKRETDRIVIPLFVFITLGLYTFVFNAARQGIAVAVYMLSFKYLFESGWKGFMKYGAFVLIAALFHKTVIVAMPLYFLFRLRFSAKYLLLIVVLGYVLGSLMPAFLSYASTIEHRYALYSLSGHGGEMLTLFYGLISVFFIYWRRYVDEDYLERYDVFLNMMIFGTLIYIVVQFNDLYIEMTRFAAYFQVASIFLWAFIYQSENRPREIYSAAIVLGHLVYFHIFCSRMANLVPYKLNPEVFQFLAN